MTENKSSNLEAKGRLSFSEVDLNQAIADEQANQRVLAEKEIAARLEAERLANLKLKAADDYGTRMQHAQELKLIQEKIEEAKAGKVDEHFLKLDLLTADKKSKDDIFKQTNEDFLSAGLSLGKMQDLIKDHGREKVLSSTLEKLELAKTQYEELKDKWDEIESEINKIDFNILETQKIIGEYKELENQQNELVEKINKLEENPDLVELLVQEATTEKTLRQDMKNALVREIQGEASLERIDFIDKMVDQFLGEEFESRGIDDIKDPDKKLDAKKSLTKDIINSLPYKDSNQLIDGAGIDNFDSKSDSIYTAKLLQNLVGNFGDANDTSKFMVRVEKGTDEFILATKIRQEALAKVVAVHLGTLNLLRATKYGVDEAGKGNTITVGFNDDKGVKMSRLEGDIRESFAFKVNPNGGPILPQEVSLAKEAKMRKDYEENLKAGHEMALELFKNQEKARQDRIKVVERDIDYLNKVVARVKEIDRELTDLGDLKEKQVKVIDFNKKIVIMDGQLANNQADLNNVPNWKYWERNKYEKERANLVADKKLYTANLTTLENDIDEIQKLQEERIAFGEVEHIDKNLQGLQSELAGLHG